MDITWVTVAVIAGAFFLAGIIDAVSGGGGLLTLPTFLLMGFPAHLVAGTNQCSCCVGSLISLGRFAKSGRIYWKTAAISAPVSLLGSILGARLNLWIPERYLQIMMMVLLPIAAATLLLNRDFGLENRSDELTTGQQVAVALFIGLIWGTYTGFYGAGSGTFILLSFALLNKLDLVTASGNTKVCSSVGLMPAMIASPPSPMPSPVRWSGRSYFRRHCSIFLATTLAQDLPFTKARRSSAPCSLWYC